MPRQISLAGLIAKNNLEQDSPWVFLFDLAFGTRKVRYIRDWSKGSTVNTANHWVELNALSPRGTNVASGKTVSHSTNVQGVIEANSVRVTDGQLSSYFDLGTSADGQPVWVKVDLGQVQDLNTVLVWHYHNDGRTYHSTKTEVSQDGELWETIFDSSVSGEYAETAAGHEIALASTVLHFVNYPEEVLWNNTVYTPYYLRMEAIREESSGSVPSLKITVSNVLREMESLLQSYSGLRGSTVTITVINKDNPAIGVLEQKFLITEAQSDARVATFTLEKAVPAFEVMLPGRAFMNDEFPGIQDRATRY
ncbi:MAG: discoidin domain-containing protein [Methanocella sp.]